MKNKAIFLDRDGTINIDFGYIHRIKDLKFYPNTLEALQILSKTDYKLIIITSQSGIGRGYFTEKDLENFMDHLFGIFKKNNIKVLKYYYCPHHAKEGKGKYNIECRCRKPKIGMIKQAEKEFNIDLEQSWMIGDKTADVKMGENAGCKTILVRTGKGGKDNKHNIKPDFTADNLYKAAEMIIDQG